MELALPQPLNRLRDRPGWILSLALHLGMVLLALWYLAGRPMVPAALPALPVELVRLGAGAARPAPRLPAQCRGAPRPARAAAPPARRRAPRCDGSSRWTNSPPSCRALAQLSAPDTSLSIGGGNGAGGAGNGNGAYGLKDFIRAQILAAAGLPDLS